VERETGKIVTGPQLRGTLRLKNAAEDRAVRLVTGTVTVLDRQGQPIRVAEGRGDTEFRFYSYQTDRLDPGAETTQSIDVPFPAAALGDASLGDLRTTRSRSGSRWRSVRERTERSWNRESFHATSVLRSARVRGLRGRL
jgi:hypothetical protein